MTGAKHSIGVVTFPISEAGAIPLANLVGILCPLFHKVCVITGNEGGAFLEKDNRKIYVINITHKLGANILTRIARFIRTQLRISYNLAKLTRNVDLWVFFIGGQHLLLPILVARLSKRKVVLVLAGTAARREMFQTDSPLVLRALDLLESINFALANRIVIYSQRLMTQQDLEKMGDKISIAHRHFLDFDKFKIQRRLSERENVVGYVGRLSEEKGVLNFVRAIPRILERGEEIEFPIGGDGQLRDEIEKNINDESLSSKVKLRGWIPHDEIPGYLNELRLLVLPSYTEGLPNVMLEAMACGTPVLATPVGAISDVIKDGETGFIMENNSPESIAKNIIRALKHPNLEQMAQNARALVEREFTFKKAVERYREILGELQSKG